MTKQPETVTGSGEWSTKSLMDKANLMLTDFRPLINRSENFLNSWKFQLIILLGNAIVPLCSFLYAYFTGQINTSLSLFQILPFTIIILPFSLARILVPSEFVKTDAWKGPKWRSSFVRFAMWGALGLFGIWTLSGGISYLAFGSLRMFGAISTLVTLFFAGTAAFSMNEGIKDALTEKTQENISRLAAIVPVMLLVLVLPLIAAFGSPIIAGIVGFSGIGAVACAQLFIHRDDGPYSQNAAASNIEL